MKKIVSVVLLLACIAGYIERDRLMPLLSAWTGSGSTTGGTVAGVAKSGQPSGRGVIGQRPPVAVRTAKAQSGTLPISRQTIGTMAAVNSANIAAQGAGVIDSIAVKDGASVKARDLLAALDDRALQAAVTRDKAAIAKDQAAVADAQVTYDRTKAALASGAVTKQSIDDADAALREANAQLAADQASLAEDQVTLDHTRITAPFDGQLGAFLVSPGDYVQPGTTIVSLTQMAPLQAVFSLPDTELAAVQSSLAAKALKVQVVATFGGAAIATGPVVFLDTSVDQATGTVAMKADIANDDGKLLPGQSISVNVQLGNSPTLVLVPSVAVRPGTDSDFVYVVEPNQTVQRRAVQVDLRLGDQAGLSKGVNDGEMVVIEGQDALSDGARVSVVDAATPSGAAPTKPGTGAGLPAGPSSK